MAGTNASKVPLVDGKPALKKFDDIRQQVGLWADEARALAKTDKTMVDISEESYASYSPYEAQAEGATRTKLRALLSRHRSKQASDAHVDAIHKAVKEHLMVPRTGDLMDAPVPVTLLRKGLVPVPASQQGKYGYKYYVHIPNLRISIGDIVLSGKHQ
ncbi:MAG: hypothetical protein MZV70_54375 [Desulfobacterales bacterium]|nr:hypothetical protein [Desulfobacterales bacterium]